MAGVEAGELIALDANFLVAARKVASREGNQLENWLHAGLAVQLSAVAWSEYLCGPVDADDLRVTRQLLTSIDPFTEQDAELAGELFNETGRRPRSHADCMIAAHAIRRHAHLATLDVHDFGRFEKFHLRLLRL